jgi:hypothetical protein
MIFGIIQGVGMTGKELLDTGLQNNIRINAMDYLACSILKRRCIWFQYTTDHL